MEDNMTSALAISGILMDAINKKYDSISDLNSIKVNISDEGYDDMNPVIDTIIEEENNHIGKLQQLVDLLSGGEEEIAEGKEETIDMIDNSDEFMESMTTMKKKLVLNENFDNVIDDVQAVADPIFVGANEEHDENKKNYEEVMKNNEKEANETIPKEGETGKKVTSKELKKMKLSEAMFEKIPDEKQEIYLDLENAFYELEDEVIYALDNHVDRCGLPMYENDSLDLKYEIEKMFDHIVDMIYSYNAEEEEPVQESLEESLQCKIAKEQLTKFAEGKMPAHWTVDTYLTRLTEKKHINESEAKSLKEWFISQSE